MTDAPRLFSTADADFQVLLVALGVLAYLLLVFVVFPKLGDLLEWRRIMRLPPGDPERERKALRLSIAYYDDELWELRRVGALGRLDVIGIQRKRQLQQLRDAARDRLLELDTATAERVSA
jgi:hypothetical protein